MKKKLFIVTCLLIALTSCSKTLYICGKPGYSIYLSSGTKIGVIDDSGKLKYKTMDYHPYLLAKAPGEELGVPFGTNIKHEAVPSNGLAWAVCFNPLCWWLFALDSPDYHFSYKSTNINNDKVQNYKK